MRKATAAVLSLSVALLLSLAHTGCASERAASQESSQSHPFDPLGGDYPQIMWMVNVFEADGPLHCGASGVVEHGRSGGERTANLAPSAVDPFFAAAHKLAGYRAVAAPAEMSKPGQVAVIAPGTLDKAHASIGNRRIELQGTLSGPATVELAAGVQQGSPDDMNGVRVERAKVAAGGAVALLLPSPTADTWTVFVVRPYVLRSVNDYPFQTAEALPIEAPPAGSASTSGTQKHIYASDHNTGKVIKIQEDGALLWDFPNANGHDVQVLANGNVLITPGTVQEVTPAKQVVWEIGLPVVQRAEAAQRLPGGNTMIADNGAHTVIDVTPQKDVVWRYEVPGNADMRQVRRLHNGNTLICASSAHVVLEVNPAKEIVWKYELPFPYLAQRLPSGNTLISSGEGAGKRGWFLIEVDAAGKTIWKYGGDGAPAGQELRWPAGFVRLSDGTIYVSEAQGAQIRVIRPDHTSVRVITSPALKHAATIAVVEE